MLEELRFKCPSCGIILEVKNSKHEAVKRITCPNCKKQLAIDFQERQKPYKDPKPISPLYYGEMVISLQEGINHIPLPDCEQLEVNVVKINDGSYKCMVSSLSASHFVKINGNTMEEGEKVVLATGDELQINNTFLSYGIPKKKPTEKPTPKSTKEEETVQQAVTPTTDRHSEPSTPKIGPDKWFLSLLALSVCFLLVFLLWPKSDASETVNTKVSSDSVIKKTNVPSKVVGHASKRDNYCKDESAQKKNQEKGEQQTSESQANSTPTQKQETKSDYELERLAMEGNVSAQYELGKRWVNKHDSINIVKGIKYLKLASQNGSNEARQALNRVSSALELEASHGNTTAENILKEQM